jgi:hypothetical protein
MKGKFTVKKSKHAFSAIAIDQAHACNTMSYFGMDHLEGITPAFCALPTLYTDYRGMAGATGAIRGLT